jgi:hypothetical protein
MLKEILLKIDEDNDIYEITINGKKYSATCNSRKIGDIYESKYAKLFDELNLAIDIQS